MRTDTPTLDPERRAALADIMAKLPGDAAMEVALYEEFGTELRRALLAIARQHQLPRIPDDELEGLTFDACAVIRKVATWWRPDGGALPWVYGRERLTALVRRHVGPRTCTLPDGGLPEDLFEVAGAHVATVDDRPAVLVLDQLVREPAHPVLRTLRDALATGSPDEAELVLQYLQQQAAGDPSPSHTVSSITGRSPEAVRQAFSRARRRLRSLALREVRFRSLLALPFLADGPPAAAPAREQAA